MSAQYIVVKKARLDALPDIGSDTSLFVRPFADYEAAYAKACSLSKQSGGDVYSILEVAHPYYSVSWMESADA